MDIPLNQTCVGVTCSAVEREQDFIIRVARVLEERYAFRTCSILMEGDRAHLRSVAFPMLAQQPAIFKEAIATAFREADVVGAVAGLGPLSGGSAGARRSLERSAEIARTLSRFDALPRIMTFEEFLPFALLLRAPDLAAEARNGVGAIYEYDESEGTQLMRTITAFIESGGIAARAAETIGIAERTLHRRVAIIERLTGRDVRNASDLHFLDLGRRALLLV